MLSTSAQLRDAVSYSNTELAPDTELYRGGSRALHNFLYAGKLQEDEEEETTVRKVFEPGFKNRYQVVEQAVEHDRGRWCKFDQCRSNKDVTKIANHAAVQGSTVAVKIERAKNYFETSTNLG